MIITNKKSTKNELSTLLRKTNDNQLHIISPITNKTINDLVTTLKKLLNDSSYITVVVIKNQ